MEIKKPSKSPLPIAKPLLRPFKLQGRGNFHAPRHFSLVEPHICIRFSRLYSHSINQSAGTTFDFYSEMGLCPTSGGYNSSCHIFSERASLTNLAISTLYSNWLRPFARGTQHKWAITRSYLPIKCLD
ncbi:hypothetical protein TNCV_2896871 [Trichonephila clavipes]|nr:hypothetical protein TNCV_2896871 [Trichonephila clavipes]